MAKITVQRTIKAPLKDVWASWDDFANIYKFNPGITHSSLLETRKAATGIGAQRVCELGSKDWIREEIIDYAPEKLMKIHIYEGTLPLKEAFATIDFKKVGARETKITFNMDFTPKFGPFGQLMVPLMKPQFKKLLGELLEGNDRFVTKGELANPEIAQAV